MKEEYISQVAKKLCISHSKKKEILRDLQEAFASALEHGETEQEVIARLGSPEEFVTNVEEQFVGMRIRQKKRTFFTMILCSFVAVVFLWLFLYIQYHRVPEHVIGQANTMTTILVSSSLPFDISWLLMAIGAGFLILAIISIIRFIGKK